MTREQSEAWRARVAALGWRADTFLVMARLFARLAHDLTPQRLTGAGRRLGTDVFQTTDWNRAYTAAPDVIGQLATGLTPRLAEQPPTEAQPGWGKWVRDTFTEVDATMKRLDSGTDPQTGYFTDEAIQRSELKAVVARAEQQVESIVVELKAFADNLTSVMHTGQPMAGWLTAALTGDREALQWVLSLNSWLSYHPKITTLLQDAAVAQDHALLAMVAHALKHQPSPRKHATVGLILVMLWDAGLNRLTYKQLRGFLKSAGLEGLPTAQALERYSQRLGLKKYVRDADPLAIPQHTQSTPR